MIKAMRGIYSSIFIIKGKVSKLPRGGSGTGRQRAIWLTCSSIYRKYFQNKFNLKNQSEEVKSILFNKFNRKIIYR